MRTLFYIGLLSLLGGCASQQVHCDWRLTPVNAPTDEAKAKE